MSRYRDPTAYKPQNPLYDKIGRAFALVFNRVILYEMSHPHTVQAIGEFFRTVGEGLNKRSPIVLIMHHDHFFVEDEPFDSRLNISRMVPHFKQAAIESIAFEKSLEEVEIEKFFRVFSDPKNYPTANDMQAEIEQIGVVHIKLNYVFYKKMTADDEAISKNELNQIRESRTNPRKEPAKEVLKQAAEGVVFEEFEKSPSLKSLADNPAEVSEQIIETDPASCVSAEAGPGTPGPVIAQQLVRLKTEVEKCGPGRELQSDPISQVLKKSAEKSGVDREEWLDKLKIDPDGAAEEDLGKSTLFKMLEESVEEGDELKKILVQVRRGIDEGDIDENNFRQIHEEILKFKANRLKGNSENPIPKGVLNYFSTLLFIEKEINRSLRYDTPFSTLTFSVFDMKPQRPVPPGAIRRNDISHSIMGELNNILRGSDIIGILNKKTFLVLLPMTDEKNARIALKRIVIKLHASPITINEIPIAVQFAGAVTSCDHDLTPDLESFLSVAKNNHNDMITRLKNLHDLM